MENEMKKELLKQNGIEYGKLSEKDQNGISRIIDRDKKRLWRMTLMVKIYWIVIAVVLLLMAAFGYFSQTQNGLASVSSAGKPIPSFVLIIIAVLFYVFVPYTIFCSIRLYMFSRSVDSRQIQLKLEQIEEQLRQMSEKEQTPPTK